MDLRSHRRDAADGFALTIHFDRSTTEGAAPDARLLRWSGSTCRRIRCYRGLTQAVASDVADRFCPLPPGRSGRPSVPPTTSVRLEACEQLVDHFHRTAPKASSRTSTQKAEQVSRSRVMR